MSKQSEIWSDKQAKLSDVRMLFPPLPFYIDTGLNKHNIIIRAKLALCS